MDDWRGKMAINHVFLGMGAVGRAIKETVEWFKSHPENK